MRSVKVAVSALVVAAVGFLLGFSVTANIVENRRYPDGCDGPCVFLAGDVFTAALIGGLATAFVVGVVVAAIVWRRFVNPS